MNERQASFINDTACPLDTSNMPLQNSVTCRIGIYLTSSLIQFNILTS